MIMIDIETLGLKPGAVIPTIGYCVFNWDRIIDRGTIAVDLENAALLGKIDMSTVKFWLQQKPEAIAKTFFRDDPEPVPLILALDQLARIIHVHETLTDPGVWGNGCLFDLGHLEHWYNQLGMKVPWHYRSPRDMRTFVEVAHRLTGWDLKVVSERLQQEHATTLTAHDAEDDAVLQALLLIDANKALVNLRRD